MHIGFANQNPYVAYWLIVAQGVDERAQELGHTLTVIAATNVDQQIEAIYSLINQRVDVILLGPVATKGLANAINAARRANIPVVVLATEILDTKTDCTIRANHTYGAELAARHICKLLEGSGKIAHLMGPSVLQDNIDRATGVRNVIQEFPSVQIVFEQESPNWSEQSGARLMHAALEQHPDIQGVCAATDTIALGAIQAIQDAGRTGQIAVTGFDASPDALTAIYEGTMSASISQAILDIGRIGVDTAQRVVAGETMSPIVLTETALITRSNLLYAAMESIHLLPKLLQNVIASDRKALQAHEEYIKLQNQALRELSTPLMPIGPGVIVMPLIGALDTNRAQQLMETVLEGIYEQHANTVILDITAVPVVDTQIANILLQTAQAVKLLGAQVVLTGIRPEIAQTVVGLGIKFQNLVTRSTLQEGVAYAFRNSV